MPGPNGPQLDEQILAAMGEKHRTAHLQTADALRTRIAEDATDVDALLTLADTNVLLYVFGYSSREETIPEARTSVRRAAGLDPSSAEVARLTGILHFLDWDWVGAEDAFLDAIRKDPQNLNARHWYSLFLVAMGRFEDAMDQSDAIVDLDSEEDFLVGRGSLMYFQHRFAELKELMERAVAKDPTVPWGYDWLGMAHNGLREHDDAVSTYLKAFELSDGTAEVGAGLGHALGDAGETGLAGEMADFYAERAKNEYVPPVQRAYIHIGLGEYDEAVRLLEQAYRERSWFLIFAKVEPWLDPLRSEAGFIDVVRRMGFPEMQGGHRM